MDPIFPQPAPNLPAAKLPIVIAPVNAIPALWQQDRIARLTALAPQDAAAALLWLAVEFDAIDDPDPGQEPEPFCAECGADIGIFLRFGLDWRHFRGDSTTIGQVELFDPGHQPVIAWRLTRVPGMGASRRSRAGQQ
jgi:hypothetical protein